MREPKFLCSRTVARGLSAASENESLIDMGEEKAIPGWVLLRVEVRGFGDGIARPLGRAFHDTFPSGKQKMLPPGGAAFFKMFRRVG